MQILQIMAGYFKLFLRFRNDRRQPFLRQQVPELEKMYQAARKSKIVKTKDTSKGNSRASTTIRLSYSGLLRRATAEYLRFSSFSFNLPNLQINPPNLYYIY
jgi:hypothetical protein